MGLSDEDLEVEKEFSPKEVRKEIILFLLRKYGNLETKDIAKVLGYNPRTVRRTLKKLAESGKVEADKLGRSYIWSPSSQGQHKGDRMLYF